MDLPEATITRITPVPEQPNLGPASSSLPAGSQIQNKSGDGVSETDHCTANVNSNGDKSHAPPTYLPQKDPKAWALMRTFAVENKTMPEVEQELMRYLGDHYKYHHWKPAFDAIFIAEEDPQNALNSIILLEANTINQPIPNSPNNSDNPDELITVDRLRGLANQDDKWVIAPLSGNDKLWDNEYLVLLEVELMESLGHNPCPFPDCLLQLACVLSQHVANQLLLLIDLLPYCRRFCDAVSIHSTWNTLFEDVALDTLVEMNLPWHRKLAKYGLEHARQLAVSDGNTTIRHLDEQSLRGAVNFVFGSLERRPGVDCVRRVTDLKERWSNDQGGSQFFPILAEGPSHSETECKAPVSDFLDAANQVLTPMAGKKEPFVHDLDHGQANTSNFTAGETVANMLQTTIKTNRTSYSFTTKSMSEDVGDTETKAQNLTEPLDQSALSTSSSPYHASTDQSFLDELFSTAAKDSLNAPLTV